MRKKWWDEDRFCVMFTLYITMRNCKKFLFHGREEIFQKPVKEKFRVNSSPQCVVKCCEQTNSAGLNTRNYGNFLSRIFGKNFVKVTVTDFLNKLLKKGWFTWFDEIFFWFFTLSHNFGKKFVKVTFLLKKQLKS